MSRPSTLVSTIRFVVRLMRPTKIMGRSAILSGLLFLGFATVGLAQEATPLREDKTFVATVLQLSRGDRLALFSGVETIQIIAEAYIADDPTLYQPVIEAVQATAKKEMDRRLKEVGLGRIKTLTGWKAAIDPQDRCALVVIIFSIHLKNALLPNSSSAVPIGALNMATVRYQRDEGEQGKPCEDAKRERFDGVKAQYLFASARFTADEFLKAMAPALRSSVITIIANVAADDEAALAEVRKWSKGE